MNMFKFSKSSLNKLATVDKKLQTLANEILKSSKVDFGISYGLRTQAEQEKLFVKGERKGDGIKKKRKHQDGKAFDFVCYKNGYITWDKKYYYYIAGLFEAKAKELNINITWGGWWSFEDCCHIQLEY